MLNQTTGNKGMRAKHFSPLTSPPSQIGGGEQSHCPRVDHSWLWKPWLTYQALQRLGCGKEGAIFLGTVSKKLFRHIYSKCYIRGWCLKVPWSIK